MVDNLCVFKVCVNVVPFLLSCETPYDDGKVLDPLTSPSVGGHAINVNINLNAKWGLNYY